MRSCYDKACEAIGLSVGGLSTKIHAKVDAFGQLINIILTPGQVHESQVAEALLGEEDCKFCLADKAYDIDSFRENLRDKRVHHTIKTSSAGEGELNSKPVIRKNFKDVAYYMLRH